MIRNGIHLTQPPDHAGIPHPAQMPVQDVPRQPRKFFKRLGIHGANQQEAGQGQPPHMGKPGGNAAGFLVGGWRLALKSRPHCLQQGGCGGDERIRNRSIPHMQTRRHRLDQAAGLQPPQLLAGPGQADFQGVGESGYRLVRPVNHQAQQFKPRFP